MSKSTGRCQHCGDAVVRKSDRGVVPAYCEKADCYRRCIIDGCDGWGRTKGYCGTHYSRYRKHGDPMGGPIYGSNVGKTCLADRCDDRAVTRGYCHPHYERFRRYGDPLGGRARNLGVCKIDGCEAQAVCRDWCKKHYGRWYVHADPLALDKLGQFMKDDPDRPTCQVSGCERDYHSNGRCRRHEYRYLRYGSVEGQPKRKPHVNCRVCDQAPPHSLYREFCSSACYAAFKFHDGAVPLTANCTVCHVEMPFLTTDSRGKKKYRRRRWCWDCKMRARSAPNAMTVEQLELRDGPACRICWTDVDMTIRGRAPLAASVDHIAPLSRGGLNVPENLQLAHLICNVRKNDKLIT